MIEKLERRDHERTATVENPVGRSFCFITCPFCKETVKAYVWSLSAFGKRCTNPTCLALHTSGNYSLKTHKTAEKPGRKNS